MIERYATPEAWAEWLKEHEGAQVSPSSIRNRIRKSGGIGNVGRAASGNQCEIFSEKDVRTHCADILVPLPIADQSGFIEVGGVRHGTVRALTRSLKVDGTTIYCHLRNSNVVPIHGKDSQGKLCCFYPELEILKLCADVVAPLPVADQSGFIEVGGIRYGTIPALARSIGICAPTVTRYLERSNVSPIRAKDCQGKPCNFFSEPDVRKLCAEFLATIPMADEDGFIEVESVRHSTIGVLARVLGIGQRTVCRHIYRSTLTPVKGRDRTGRFYDFYPEPAVHALFDHLLILPVADKSGFLMVDSVLHGTIESLARLLGISTPTILSRIRGPGVVSVRGRAVSGNACDFYPEPAIRELCGSILALMPQAGADGFAEVDGVRHGTVYALTQSLGISRTFLRRRLGGAALVPIKGKDKGGNITDFYAEPAVRELCADHLAPLPVADESGFVLVNDVRYGGVSAFGDLLGLSGTTVSSRLGESGIVPIRGKSKKGQLSDFYPEPAVREACADLLFLPKADETGFVVIDNIRHTTIGTFSDLLKIDQNSVYRRLDGSDIASVRGRDRQGKPCDLFPEPSLLRACSDILAPLPQAYDDNLLDVDGICHGTISALSRLMGLSKPTLSSRIQKSDTVPVRGRGENGNPYDFFSEPAVRELCADLLDSSLVQVGEDGFAEINGVRHGTMESFAHLFGLSPTTISSRLYKSGAPMVRGKDKSKHVCDLFPEPAVCEACADLLVPLPVADKDGFITASGIRHGTPRAFGRLLGLHQNSVASRIQKSDITPVRGRGNNGSLYDFFSEPAVRELCRDLIERKNNNPKSR